LEQALYRELAEAFLIVRIDAAAGISFYDDRDGRELQRVCTLGDTTAPAGAAIGDVAAAIAANRHEPLPTLVLLRAIIEAVTRVRRAPEESRRTKPLCAIVQFAGSMFPAGDFDRLSEIDRQRLITFLNLISDPSFVQSPNLIILVSDTQSEVNGRVRALPSFQHLQIELPNAAERALYVNHFQKARSDILFEVGLEAFVADTAGLKLTGIQDLLEVSARTGEKITRRDVMREVNGMLETELGEIVRINMPEHGPEDIVGYPQTCEILRNIFRRCEDPDTAVSAVLVSGPNGGGKTFQLEAFASDSGRTVIELTGLRGMYFGQTDKFFELLRWHIRTYGKILILVDEAHTAFGSVHSGEVHETEQRLAGNIIKMMGDKQMLGKVVWGLMTSRPDELDPDVKSRAPIQVPIFDLEGEARRSFVRDLFSRRGIKLADADLDVVMKRTEHYSARDYFFLIGEVKAAKKPVQAVLETWTASTSIVAARRLQTLIASRHCSYPQLLPQWIRDMDPNEIDLQIETLKRSLLR
jgi:hypothetical protein